MQCNVNQTLTTTAASSLFMASQIGNVNTVKVLIEAGGNLNQATTDDGSQLLIDENINFVRR